MPIQAFIDESGIDGQGPVLVFAGLIGQSADWARFSDDWQAVLDAKPKVPVFKMHDAAACQGAFSGWSSGARDKRLRQLAEVLGRYPFTAVHCTMDVAGFSETIRTDNTLSKPMRQLYFWPFHITIMAVGYELLEQGQTERFEIIFDKNAKFGPRAKAWFPIIKASAEVMDPEVHAIFPIEPTFKSDDEFLPLQAADMLAWLFRRAWSRPEEVGFGWIAEELQKSIPMSAHSQFLPRERMAFQISLSKTPEFTAKALRIIEEYRDREGLGGYPF